jgi:uncharacterized protein DUF702
MVTDTLDLADQAGATAVLPGLESPPTPSPAPRNRRNREGEPLPPDEWSALPGSPIRCVTCCRPRGILDRLSTWTNSAWIPTAGRARRHVLRWPESAGHSAGQCSGQASLTTTFTTEGAYEITAAYNGNGNCDASNAATTAQVTSEPPRPVQQANAYRFP